MMYLTNYVSPVQAYSLPQTSFFWSLTLSSELRADFWLSAGLVNYRLNGVLEPCRPAASCRDQSILHPCQSHTLFCSIGSLSFMNLCCKETLYTKQSKTSKATETVWNLAGILSLRNVGQRSDEYRNEHEYRTNSVCGFQIGLRLDVRFGCVRPLVVKI